MDMKPTSPEMQTGMQTGQECHRTRYVHQR